MNRNPHRAARLADVAARAGVSVSTASKVLNGRPGIADATRVAVEEAMVAVGYTPSVAPARSQRQDDARPVMVVFDTLTNIYSQNVLEGILDAARETLVPVQVSNLGNRETPPDFADRRWLDAIVRTHPRALVLVTAQVDAVVLDRLRSAKVPLVAVDPQLVADESVVSVGATNWAGGKLATEHLLALGHTRIGFLGANPHLLDFQERLGGWRQALASAGIEADPDLVVECPAVFEDGLAGAERLLALPNPPSAVVAAQDLLAIGAIAAVRRRGLRMPDDLSVVGYDDTYASLWPDPPLTSVRLPLHEIGAVALRTADAMAHGTPPVSRHVQLATSLVVRGSTGPAPGRRPAGG